VLKQIMMFGKIKVDDVMRCCGGDSSSASEFRFPKSDTFLGGCMSEIADCW